MRNIKLTIARCGSAVFGIIALGTGAKMLFEGASGKLGAGATLLADPGILPAFDNDFRFLAAVWLIVGLALVVGAILVRKKPDLIQIGLEAIFVGGLARAISSYQFDTFPQFAGPIVIELIPPVVLLILLKLGLKEVNAHA